MAVDTVLSNNFHTTINRSRCNLDDVIWTIRSIRLIALPTKARQHGGSTLLTSDPPIGHDAESVPFSLHHNLYHEDAC